MRVCCGGALQVALESLMKVLDWKQEEEGDKPPVALIFAGYKSDMDKLIATNAGIARRLMLNVELPDFSPEQLAEMLYERVRRQGTKPLDQKPRVTISACGLKWDRIPQPSFPQPSKGDESVRLESKLLEAKLKELKEKAMTTQSAPLRIELTDIEWQGLLEGDASLSSLRYNHFVVLEDDGGKVECFEPSGKDDLARLIRMIPQKRLSQLNGALIGEGSAGRPGLIGWARDAALERLDAIDSMVADEGVVLKLDDFHTALSDQYGHEALELREPLVPLHKQAGRLDKLRAGVITLQPCKYISLDVDRFDLQTAKSQIAEIKGPGDLLKVFERVGINRCARNLIPASCARAPLTSAR